jgi:hypothetical protein
LAAVEAGAVPSIYKIFSLAACFRVPYQQMLFVFDLDVIEAEQAILPEQAALLEKETIAGPLSPAETPVQYQPNLGKRISLAETQLLDTESQAWVIVPMSLRSRLQPRRFSYALMGLEDDSMGDFIPSGSLVEVDTDQNQIQRFSWRSPRERPIYLTWHEKGYSCSWCQQDQQELLLVPHHASHHPIQRFKIPRQASVIGRAVNIWSSLESTGQEKMCPIEAVPKNCAGVNATRAYPPAKRPHRSLTRAMIGR